MKFQESQLKSKQILDEIKKINSEINRLHLKRDRLIDQHSRIETAKFMDTHFTFLKHE